MPHIYANVLQLSTYYIVVSLYEVITWTNYCTRIHTGKILHLDGDKRYTDKSSLYYKKAGLQAVVKYIPEYRQPAVVRNLLKKYNPDILVITGHDGMIKKRY